MVQCCCTLEHYAYIRIFEQIGNFSDLWAVEGKCCPDFLSFLLVFLLLTLCSICRLSFSSRCCGTTGSTHFYLTTILLFRDADPSPPSSAVVKKE